MGKDEIYGEWEHYTAQQREQAFGYHLMLDAYRCDSGKIDNLDACYQFLDEMVDVIGAEKQTQPYVFRTPEHFVGKEGLSGWVPIVESGISIHTLRTTRFISIDVYSCRAFDCPQVISFLQDFFSPENIEHRYVLRGLLYQNEPGCDSGRSSSEARQKP